MRNRLLRFFAPVALALAIGAIPAQVSAQSTPSANRIYKSLSAPAPASIRRQPKVSIGALKRNSRLRKRLPSINIQSINFEFGSANIPHMEFWKVGNIATAIKRIARRRRGELFLLEGHTDAVGSERANLRLSKRRALSLKRTLVRMFGVRPHILETAGYGEYDLLVPTQRAEWRNRRVTIRRVGDVVYR